MKRKTSFINLIKSAFLLAVLLVNLATSTASAMDVQFFQSNNILYYDPGEAGACIVNPNSPAGAGTTSTGNGANNNRDYKGDQIISDSHMEKIKKNQPVYEKAAAETKIPWQIFAVLHIRETVLADFNPENGQGIYQDFERGGNGGVDYPPGPVTDEEFLRQTIYAGEIVKEKSGSKFDLLQQGDTDAIKDMFFGYNGRADYYIDQAIALGFSPEEAKIGEGSPYVMNIADEKRDPEVAGSDRTWGQVKRDLGPIEYPANGDHGAYIMYAALAGVATSSGGSCTTGGSIDSRFDGQAWPVSGPNAMQVYYQIDPPWNTQSYGIGTINDCGCGPTSVSMAVATLAKLPESEMNPKIMADLFVDNGGQVGGGSCGSYLPNPEIAYTILLSEKYGLKFTPLGTDLNNAKEALGRGSLVVMSADGGVLAPLGGHVLLLRGTTTSGNFLVADPASHERTENENGFTPEQVRASLHNGFWEVRKA